MFIRSLELLTWMLVHKYNYYYSDLIKLNGYLLKRRRNSTSTIYKVSIRTPIKHKKNKKYNKME